ncbi:probable rRNA-processing protein EBP2 homolog [Uranotaenia lowii]|uniref:probable rRNA-processing protein EBP2 homolog n=1 Tax=Uranotaenia lowii TaxID=190385 RepID=UPI00247AAD0E|nr:probable rRNA-processing protein EBP2 homolog [Uranotaenia lowii]
MPEFDVSGDESDSSYVSYDEDDELREALAKGLLKPGLNVIPKDKQEPVNNVPKLKSALETLILKAPWVERLDLVNDLAPLTPELAIQIEKHEQKRENQFKGNKKIPYVAPQSDPVLNDFKREILFHRQAQAAVVEGIKRLHELNIVTKRPDDYFAEMAKTDEHMQRIRKVLLAKQEGIAKSERARQLREQRRIGKLIQRQATEKRDEERRKMLNDIKKFRKGKLSNLDFLDDDEEGGAGGAGRKKKNAGRGSANKKQPNAKRKAKNAKFGFGGKKKGTKRNNKESFLNDGPKKKAGMKKGGGGGGAGGKRLGKNRRAQMKSRGK